MNGKGEERLNRTTREFVYAWVEKVSDDGDDLDYGKDEYEEGEPSNPFSESVGRLVLFNKSVLEAPHHMNDGPRVSVAGVVRELLVCHV